VKLAPRHEATSSAAAGVGGELGDAPGDVARGVGAEAAAGDLVEVPRPAAIFEAEEADVAEPLDHAVREEGVAPRPEVGEAGEGGDVAVVAAEGVGEEGAHVVEPEGGEREAGEAGAEARGAGEGAGDEVGVVDLALAPRAEHQDAAEGGVGEEALEERRARHVGPLEVVDEEDDGAARLGERAEERDEGVLEAALGLGRGELARRAEGAREELELGERLGEDGGRVAERGGDARAPRAEPRGVEGEERLEVAPQRRHHRGVGDRALKLFELPREEGRPARGRGAPRLADERRLARARRARHEHRLARARRRPRDGRVERGEVLAPAVERVGDAQRLLPVAAPRREGGRVDARAERVEAAVEVVAQARRALVAVVGPLRQEHLHDGRDGLGDVRRRLADGARRAREVGVDDLHRVGPGEGGGAVRSS
jgi:hypothetical protein